MTTTFNYSKRYIRSNRKNSETGRLTLFSPFALLLLVGLLFAFFITASNKPAYLQNATEQESTAVGESKPDPVTMYQKVVTNADAIRSVLQ